MTKIIKSLFLSLTIASILSTSIVFAYSSEIEAYGLDTMAGYSTYLRTSETYPDASIVFKVVDPNGESVELASTSNSDGVAQSELSNYFTQQAGSYLVSAKLENDLQYSSANAFTVHSGELSQAVSEISPTEQIIRSFSENAQVSVTLLDEYGNPLSDHLVKLISSSDYDVISSTTEFTNSNGKISFDISSSDAGTVYYSAYDVTADEVLDARARVVYFNDEDYIFVNDIPEQYQFAAVGNSDAVDSLSFENAPSSIGVGETITFDLSAKDTLNQNVTDYLGSVRFSVTSDNSFFANLPEDYTFTVDDLGSHTFSLAMSFQESGTYTIEARDLDDITIYGEYDFIVSGSGTPDASSVTITNPTSGTYSNNIQVISGVAPAGTAIKIFDNDLELHSMISDASGAFTYTTGSLVDGTHDIYIATVNEVGTITGTSETVSLNIDTSGPEITSVELEPTGEVDPGTIITAKIYTNDDLSQAAIIFQDNIYETVKSNGYYEGSFAAPIEFGEYSMGLVIVDQLGNESTLEDQGTVSVGVLPEVEVVASVGDVAGLSATSFDRRISLEWAPVVLSENLITNYRVFYGLSPNQLTEAVDTFTTSTTWYVPNLNNGVEYYFAVIAVDEKGNVSEHFSNIVSSTPGPDVVEIIPLEVEIGTSTDEAVEAIEELEKDPSEAGPEIIWLVVFSLLGGFGYTYFRNKQGFSYNYFG